MKRILLLLLALSLNAFAQEQVIQIKRVPYGSGLQNERGFEPALAVPGGLGVFHAPQFMPGFPTASTIWPRVVDVKCENNVCEGYESAPALGRGEYLFFRPIPMMAQAVSVQPVVTPTLPRQSDREINKPINQ